MSKKIVLSIAIFLFLLNVLCWQEVFTLSGGQKLVVGFLDVGQGDSAFIQTPEGHQILIDGGPGSTVLEKLSQLMPFWDKSLDVVILTHPEKDHMAGILEILQKYKVDYFLWTGVVKNDAENKKLATLLEKAQKSNNKFLASLSEPGNTKIITASAGQEIKAGSVLFNILYPLENLNGKEVKSTSNDSCLVSKITFGKSSFLFACDISSVAEKKLVSENIDLQADVLKVAHHGSKYSTSDIFLSAVKPEVAVIEVGKNSYGHPTPETLQRLEKSGIKVLRTDKDGDVKFVSDGINIKIK